MAPWNPPNLWIYTLAIFKPRSLRPDLFAPSISNVDWHALRARGFDAVVVDKDNCLTLPDRDELCPQFQTGWNDLKEAFGPSRVLVVSNSAGTKKDPAGIAAESVSRNLGVPVLIHRRNKPGCASDIMAYFNREIGVRPISGFETNGPKGAEWVEDLITEEKEARRDSTLMGTVKRARVSSLGDAQNSDRGTLHRLASSSSRMTTLAPPPPSRIIVVGDRLSTDVLLSRRLSLHIKSARSRSSTMTPEEVSPDDSSPPVLSIITTDLPKRNDVRLLRWLESSWSRVGMKNKRSEHSIWQDVLIKSEKEMKLDAEREIAESKSSRSLLSRLRSLRSLRIPTFGQALRWIGISLWKLTKFGGINIGRLGGRLVDVLRSRLKSRGTSGVAG